jgi:diguanylate cyclase (GGDEF)-like protein
VSIRRLSFDGHPAVIAGFWDMTGQKELEEKLRHMALHDPLTGLPNRAYFFDLLRGELARARRDPFHTFAVLFIDLDGFKRVNDTLGHDAGDAVLVEVALRLRACLRETDTAARVGGDEFTVLLVQTRDAAEAGAIADRMVAAISAPIRVGDQEAVVGASIGISLGNPLEDDPGDVLRHADGAMYRAKAARKAAPQAPPESPDRRTEGSALSTSSAKGGTRPSATASPPTGEAGQLTEGSALSTSSAKGGTRTPTT